MLQKVLKGALVIIFICIIASGGALFAMDRYLSDFDVEGEVPANLDTPLPDRINILLIGSDKGGSNTDVLMLATFDKEANKIRLMSIPRDTRVLIKGKPHKINACMAYGKEELLLKTIKDITGAPIHYYLKVDIAGFKEVVDILGGVDFNVPQDMKYSDPSQDLKINLKAGMQHLDGDKAEQLVRFRRYQQADIQRVHVQQDFMKALISQNLNPQLIVKAPKLYGEIYKYVKTNLKGSDVLKNLGIINALLDGEDNVETSTLPGAAKYVNRISYFIFDVEESLAFCKENFGGSGTSDQKEAYIKEQKSH
jgi:LCP family protein required for cell wall assembly